MEFVGIDKFSLLDYDEKISVVLFAKPCNFRCPFCHNGESVLNANTEIPFEDIITYLKDRIGKIDAVVISGGEPTLMDDLEEKISRIKKLGYLVKLDTNGTNPEVVKNLIDKKLIDYVAMDIKNAPNKYDVTAGITSPNLENIEKTIQILNISGIEHEFRTTLVKEFHNEESIIEMSKFLSGCNKLILQKFVDRDGVIQKGLHNIFIEEANHFKEILSHTIKCVELRGY